jgi:hypothetical protein
VIDVLIACSPLIAGLVLAAWLYRRDRRHEREQLERQASIDRGDRGDPKREREWAIRPPAVRVSERPRPVVMDPARMRSVLPLRPPRRDDQPIPGADTQPAFQLPTFGGVDDVGPAPHASRAHEPAGGFHGHGGHSGGGGASGSWETPAAAPVSHDSGHSHASSHVDTSSHSHSSYDAGSSHSYDSGGSSFDSGSSGGDTGGSFGSDP